MSWSLPTNYANYNQYDVIFLINHFERGDANFLPGVIYLGVLELPSPKIDKRITEYFTVKENLTGPGVSKILRNRHTDILLFLNKHYVLE